MIWMERAAQFSGLDYAALATLVLSWFWIGWRIENPPDGRPSVSALMEGFRRLWMQQMITRQPRMVDSQLIGHLRQGTAFFASTSMIAIGGGLALIGNTDRLAGVARELALDSAPAFVWEVKILIVLLFLSNAFLKFVWAHRLFGYCGVVMAAVPNDPGAPLAEPRAKQAAELSITAARSFNRAMRSIYFALAAISWLLGAVVLMAAALATMAVLYRREFSSHSRQFLLETPPDTEV